jgi:hypothetical protein
MSMTKLNDNFFFGLYPYCSILKKAQHFGSQLCSASDKEATNLVDIDIKLFSVTVHHTHLLTYAPENRSSPTVVTGRWQLKN